MIRQLEYPSALPARMRDMAFQEFSIILTGQFPALYNLSRVVGDLGEK